MTQPSEDRAVAVAVATYRRPGVLPALLPEVVRQGREQPTRVRVVVVDNDPEAGARATVDGLGLPEVTYVHEPHPGISAARNAALDEAGDCATVVFIDDDETPDPGWLTAMLDAHARFGGAAVVGPVLRDHEVVPAPWVAAARVFDRRRMPTGTPREVAGSGNLLLDLDHVRRHRLRFDDRLGLAGGSDHLFTKQLRAAGGLIHWCDEAIVRETVPAARLTGAWTMRRGFRSGSTATHVDLMLAPSWRAAAAVRARSLLGGAARVVVGALRAALGVLTRNPDQHGLGAWTMARGAGMVSGTFGHRYVEYRR